MHSFTEANDQSKMELDDNKIKLEEFQNLAKRIIQTDIIFQKLTVKEQENESLNNDLLSIKTEKSQLHEKYKHLIKENDLTNKKNKNLTNEISEYEKNLDETNSKLKEHEKNEKKFHKEIETLSETNNEFELKIQQQAQIIDSLKLDLRSSETQCDNFKLEIERLKLINENLKKAAVDKQKENLPTTVPSPRKSSVIFTISSESSSSMFGVDENTNIPSVVTKSSEDNTKFFLLSDDEDTVNESQVSTNAGKKQEKKVLDEKPLEVEVDSKIKEDKIDESKKAEVSLNETNPEDEEKQIAIDDLQLSLDKIPDESQTMFDSDSYSTSSDSSSSSSSDSSDNENEIESCDKSLSNKSKHDSEDPLNFDLSDDEATIRDVPAKKKDDGKTLKKDEDKIFEKIDDLIDSHTDEYLSELCDIEVGQFIKEKLDIEDSKLKQNELIFENLIDEFIQKQTDSFIEDFLHRASIEFNHCELYRDKLLTEEIKGQSTLISTEVIKEEHADRKLKEKQMRIEMKENITCDLVETFVNEKVDNMIQECCERVLLECKNERIESIYNDFLDDIMPKLIEKELFDGIFNEMNSLKPVIQKISPAYEILDAIESIENIIPKQTRTPQKRPLQTSKKSMEAKEEFRPIINHDDPKQESQYFNESVPKRAKHDFSPIYSKAEVRGPSEQKFKHNNKGNQVIKNCIAEYMRAYNPKSNSFSYEILDTIIKKIQDSNTCLKSFSNVLIGHYINNSFIPLDENKLLQQDLYELNLFKDLHTLFELKNKAAHTSHMHLAYKQNKVDKCLHLRISNEEEKYVYLVKQLNSHPRFDSLLDVFLMKLKTMLFSVDFTDHYKYRISRMICILCKQTENFEYIRCLIYDLVAVKNRVMPETFHKIILVFARIWPDILQWPFSAVLETNKTNYDYSKLRNSLDLASSFNPILCSVIYIVQNHLNNFSELSNNYSNESMHSKYYSYILETLCNWSQSFSDMTEILKQFHKDLNKLSQNDEVLIMDEKELKLTPLMFEYLQSFKLLCMNEGWEWTCDTFLKNYIKRALEDATNIIETSKVELTRNKAKKLIAFYLLVQGSITSHMCPKSDKNTASKAMFSFELLLKKNEASYVEDYFIECASIENLLLLAPFNPIRALSRIKEWLVKCKNLKSQTFKVPSSLERKVKATYEFYKKHLPTTFVILI